MASSPEMTDGIPSLALPTSPDGGGGVLSTAGRDEHLDDSARAQPGEEIEGNDVVVKCQPRCGTSS